jgi:hypothetical protein
MSSGKSGETQNLNQTDDQRAKELEAERIKAEEAKAKAELEFENKLSKGVFL